MFKLMSRTPATGEASGTNQTSLTQVFILRGVLRQSSINEKGLLHSLISKCCLYSPYFIIFVYGRFACICLCTVCMSDTHGSQKETSNAV